MSWTGDFFCCSRGKDYQAVGKGLIFFKLETTEVEDIKSKCSHATLLQDELEVSILLIFWNEMSKMPTTCDFKNFSPLQHLKVSSWSMNLSLSFKNDFLEEEI